jgi:hypothetical protein
MIERMTDYLDWVNSLPIEAQCHFAIGLSFFGFVVAAAARETCKRSDVRYLARAIGAASFFAVAAFASHVSHEYEKLNTELMVRRGTHDVEQTEAVATQIADPVRVVVVESEYTATVGNQTVSLVKYSDGRIGSVSVAGGRKDPVWNRAGSSVGQSATKSTAGYGQVNRFDDVSHEQHAVTF